MTQRVVLATSEMYPFSKTGGLGDVMGAMPLALHGMGIPTAVITPFYGRLRTGKHNIRLIIPDLHVGYPWEPVTAEVYQTVFYGMPVYFIERGEYFDRKYYYNTTSYDYFDNAERFIFFARACISLIRRLGGAPAIVHAHDWQASLLPSLIYYYRQWDPYWEHTSTVFTVHNLAFQGRFSSRLFEGCGLPPESWSMHGVEYYGDFNMLKGAICFSDKITTVSPSYAKEILTEKFGCGLDGVLRAREKDLIGILNGADYDIWNPETSKYLPFNYTANELSGKQACKESLIQEVGLSAHLEDRPVLGFIGRLRGQKGIDLLNDIVPDLMKHDIGIIVLGEGSPEQEALSLNLMEKYYGRYAACVEYTEDLAHRVHAGSDFFLMPSRYEPCGLTQMYALRYGTPPIATAVGGLCDTIIPWPASDATGFIFQDSTARSLYQAIIDAVKFWESGRENWKEMVVRAMAQQFTWKQSAKKYSEVYSSLRQQRRS